jgi:hypothetical protein
MLPHRGGAERFADLPLLPQTPGIALLCSGNVNEHLDSSEVPFAEESAVLLCIRVRPGFVPKGRDAPMVRLHPSSYGRPASILRQRLGNAYSGHRSSRRAYGTSEMSCARLRGQRRVPSPAPRVARWRAVRRTAATYNHGCHRVDTFGCGDAAGLPSATGRDAMWHRNKKQYQAISETISAKLRLRAYDHVVVGT